MRTLSRRNNDMFPALSSFFDDFLFNDQGSRESTLPSINVKESNDDYLLEVAAPGMKKDDFKIELNDDVLTISSEKQQTNEEKDSEGNYTRREFSYQSFTRSFTLPSQKIMGDNIQAKYTDGILYITIPKREEAKKKPSRVIDIS